MREPRYIAVHRGGPLRRPCHQQLAQWAAPCAEYVLPLFERDVPQDDRLPRFGL